LPNRLDDAIAKAGLNKPARKPRAVKMSERGRPPSDKSRAKDAPVYSAIQLAEMLGVHRDTIYQLEKEGMPRAPCGKGWTLPIAWRFNAAREREAGRRNSFDPTDDYEIGRARKVVAQAGVAELELAEKWKELVPVTVAQAIYEDDSARVATHLRGMGARLMNDLAVEDDPDEVMKRIDADIEEALEKLNGDHIDPASEDRHPYLGGEAEGWFE
jgi:phage terminase Nu1 subunit (DNA packaging protein)